MTTTTNTAPGALDMLGGFDKFDTVVHPDHEGTWHPWKTPTGLLEQGLLLLRSIRGDNIITADIERLQHWEVVHPSWCSQKGPCDTTAGDGSLEHRKYLAHHKSLAPKINDAQSWEVHEFTAHLDMVEMSDSVGRSKPSLVLEVEGELANGWLYGSADQMRQLGASLQRWADIADGLVDEDYLPAR